MNKWYIIINHNFGRGLRGQLVELVPLTCQFLIVNENLTLCTKQCHKVIDSWDLILVLLITRVEILGILIFLVLSFLICKVQIIIVRIPTTLGIIKNNFFSQPIFVL